MTAVAAVALVPATAHAQRASENAVASAEDAFGTNVGLENTGIYSESDTRGFSPTKAGNVRADGIYFDSVGNLAGRVRESTAIRVGFAAAEYPFHAPTGIVDHRFRGFPSEFGVSPAFHRGAYGGWIFETDVRLPVIDDHLSLTGGIALSDSRQSDGSGNYGHGLTIRPIIRFAGVEIAPFTQQGGFRNSHSRPLTVVTGASLPRLPAKGRYLGQRWAKGSSDNNNSGVTIKAAITDQLSLRGGVFFAEADRIRNFTEIFSIIGPTPDPTDDPTAVNANELLIADPEQDVQSTSGEAQVAWNVAAGDWQHRIIAGYRARNRLTETGGSDRRPPRVVLYGTVEQRPEESFSYRPVNSGRVRQSALMIGYVGKLRGVGSVNLGLQKARYRGTSRDGLTGVVDSSRDSPWLYNAIVQIDASPVLSFYAGIETGLEDSGTAPENAANRNAQLPATRSKQQEGGVRWRFRGGQLVINAFQITKPYFSFDAAGVYAELGRVRHRGLETSLSGHFGERFSLVAGALIMQPRVSGAAVDSGLLGKRPAGTPSLYARIDANYRTDIFGGLTPTAAFTYTGRRAVGSRPLAGKQLMVGALPSLDLGFRQQLRLAGVPASIRAVMQNVFDVARWKVAAANTIYPDERRRVTISVAADF